MCNSGRRLLICSQGVPHKSIGASAVIFYHYLEYLKKLGLRILHILLLEKDRFREDHLATYISEMEEKGRFDVAACRTGLFISSARHRVNLDKALLQEAAKRAKDFCPDAIFCIDFLSAWAALQIHCKKRLVWLGDLNFETFWYHSWYAVKEGRVSLLRAPMYLAEAWINCKAWKKAYRRVLNKIDRVIVSSRCSEERLRPLGISSHYLPYPWPVKSSGARGFQEPNQRIPSFLFYGTLIALGSRSAFHFMIEKLYPALIALWGRENFQIFICGLGQLPQWVERAIAERPEFKWLGFVPDLDDLMCSCHAVLAPIDVPLGNRTRILSAMASGTLVIAHRNTSLGNPDLVDGQTCFLARNCREFVERMRIAVEQPDKVKDIRIKAQQCYHRRFDPQAAADLLARELMELM